MMSCISIARKASQQIVRQKYNDAVQTEQLPSLFAQKFLLSSETLKGAVSECKSPFLGNVPDVFYKVAKTSEQDIITALNGLAKQLKKAKDESNPLPATVKIIDGTVVEVRNWAKRLRVGSSKKAIQIHKVGSGFWADVYKLRVKDQDFVMKVFREPDMAYSETAIGIYYTQGRQTSDLSRLFAANPANPEASWTLMEFIPATAKLEDRAGQTLAEQRARISDHNEKNLINGIRVDHGGTVTVKDTLFRPPVGFGAKPKQARRIIFPVPD